jgi:DNA-binding NtrC family response regulator
MNGGVSRILIVDDDEDNCRNLSDILIDVGYVVDYALEGRAALDLVAKSPYDVALLDLKMPGMSGLELYHEIKKLRAATVAMIVTAYASSATGEQARAAGAWKVVPKPVNFPALLQLVNEALGQPLVLVVDDDVDLCANLWDTLRERGYRVSLAHSAGDAAEQLFDLSYQVVLIDMRLPDSSGTLLLQEVRRKSPSARTVLITGHCSEMSELADKALAEGADAVCYKPFDVTKLLSLLEGFTKTRS